MKWWRFKPRTWGWCVIRWPHSTMTFALSRFSRHETGLHLRHQSEAGPNTFVACHWSELGMGKMISETWKDENCTVFLTNVLCAQHPSKLSAAAPPVTNLQRCTALQIGMLEWGEMYTYPVLLAWWSLAESFPAHPAVALGKTLRPFYRKASFPTAPWHNCQKRLQQWLSRGCSGRSPDWTSMAFTT